MPDVAVKIGEMIAQRARYRTKAEKSSNLYYDLGFDSLMFISLIVDIENKFGVEIGLEELEQCLSVGKLIETVERRLEEK